jgi:signal transduction histidine kinase
MVLFSRLSQRPLLLDVIYAILAGLAITAGTIAAGLDQTDMKTLDWAGYALLWVAAAGVAIRRTWPGLAVAITFGATMTYILLRYPYGPIFLFTMITIYSLAAWRGARYSIIVVGCCLLAHVPSSLWLEEKRDTLFFTVVTTAFWLVTPLATGIAVRLNRESHARAHVDERNRHVYEQRLRIAQEVHDVVGHSLAVISVNAGAALHVLTKQSGPPQVSTSLRAIRQASSSALEELRSALDTFTGAVPGKPPRGLAALPELVSASSVNGLRVRLDITGTPSTFLPSALDISGYRIVQESLANIVRHAKAHSAVVAVDHEPGQVRLTITDDGAGGVAGPGGTGLESMGERARALGGSFQAGPLDGGGFQVRAVLPVRVS